MAHARTHARTHTKCSAATPPPADTLGPAMSLGLSVQILGSSKAWMCFTWDTHGSETYVAAWASFSLSAFRDLRDTLVAPRASKYNLEVFFQIFFYVFFSPFLA